MSANCEHLKPKSNLFVQNILGNNGDSDANWKPFLPYHPEHKHVEFLNIWNWYYAEKYCI